MSRKKNAEKLVETVKSLMESDTNLRNSQVKALHQYTDKPETPERGIFNLATGVGKTRIMSMLALAHLQNNPKSQIVVGVPNTELFEQELGSFQDYRDFQEKQRKKLGLPALGIPEKLEMGVFNQFDKNTTSQIIFTSYHSLENLARRMDTSKVGLLLLDEAHHAVSEKRSNAVNSFTNAFHYGMTATPWYSPDRNAENVLGEIIAKISIRDAIQEAALAEYKNVLMVSNLSVDLSKVQKDSTGDYKEKDYCEAVLSAMRGNSANSGNKENWQEAHHYIAREVARFYHNYVDENVGVLSGKKCLINCRSQEEARIQAQELNKLFGRMVARVHTSDECESQTIQDFKEGDLPIVCQVGKLTEGFDMPNLDMTINYPTASYVREAQGAARCIRLPKVDSKTPQMMPKKMGLVVDIAFKHPEYDNIVDAIRQNGQILFQDVDGVNGSIIQHTDESLRVEEIDKEELEKLRKERPQKEEERLGFTIVSSVRELQRLTREADKLADEREIPLKRDGMRSSNDLKKEFGVSFIKIKQWYEECYEKGIKFYLKEDVNHENPIDLIQLVRFPNNVPYLALDEHPEALEALIEMHPEIKKSLESKEKLKNKKIPLKRDGMRSTEDFHKEFGIKIPRIKEWYEECVEKGIKFYLKDDVNHEHPIDLVQWVKPPRGRACLALHEAPEALETFLKMFPELQKILKNKEVPLKRDGMKSANDFGIDHQMIKQWYEECYEKGIKFYLKEDVNHENPIDLIQLVKSNGGFPYLALDEHPEALETFLKMFPKLQKILKNKEVPLKRDGMKSANDFKKEFVIKDTKVKKWFEECVEKGIKFYLKDDVNHEHPIDLVQQVRSERGAPYPYLALDEHPEALETFKEWLKKTHGVELKERTTSPTLRPRLKAGSTQGKPKAPPVRKPATPEI